MYSSSSGECQCGDNLNGVVYCDSDSKQISLLQCYCMSYNSDFNMTVVGPCNTMCKENNVLNVSDVVSHLTQRSKKPHKLQIR